MSSVRLQASTSYDFTYEGRITDPSGKPFQGTFALQIDFYHEAEGGSPVLTVTDGLGAVPLASGGIFQVKVSLVSEDFAKVFPDVSQPVYVAFTDLTHSAGQPLARQQVMMLPYAGKVPVDGKTVRFGADGKLTAAPRKRPKSGEFLTMDSSGEFSWATPMGNVVTGAGVSGGPTPSTANSKGRDLVLSAGNGTGNGGSGAIVMQTAPPVVGGNGINGDSLTTRVVIEAAGNVGIGTSSPVSTLSVNGTANFTRNIGIGTTNPQTLLEVVNTNSDSTRGIVSTQFSDNTLAPNFVVRKARGTPTSPAPVLAGDVIGNLTYWGYDGSDFQQSTALRTLAAENFSKAGIGSHFTILTSPVGIKNNIERFRITSEGNVGISTTSPTHRLSLGNDLANTKLAIWEGGAGSSFGLGVQNGQFRLNLNQSTDVFSFLNGEAGTEIVRILGNGKVGIGTTAPYANLEVKGGANPLMAGYTTLNQFATFTNDWLTSSIGFNFRAKGDYMNWTQVTDGQNNGSALIASSIGGGGLMFFTFPNNGPQNFDIPDSTLYNYLRMRIAPSGAVAIGTSWPSSTLTVNGSVFSSGGDFQFSDGGVMDSSAVRLFSNAGNLYLQNGAGGATYFRNRTATIRMTVLDNGNVGIGTTSPLNVLHVQGGIQATGPGAYLGGNGVVLSSESSHDRLQTFNNRPLSINPLGNSVGIGTTSPSYTLHVVGTAGLSSGTSWTNASDRRLKDIEGDYEYGLAEVRKLHPIRFRYKKDNPLHLPSDQDHTGFIAQEVREIIPEAVHERPDGFLELNVDPIHWATINAVRQLAAEKDIEIEKLRNRLIRTEQEAATLKARSDQAEIEAQQLRKQMHQLKGVLCAQFGDLPMCVK